MLKYTLSGKQTLADLMNRSTMSTNYSSSGLDPKNLPNPSPNTLTPKKNDYQTISSTYLGSKIPRPSYEAHNTNNNSFSRLSKVTPDKDKPKKEVSYATPVKHKKLDLLDTSLQNQNGCIKTEQKAARTDRSQRVLKTTVLRDLGNKEIDKYYLRQTVSNANTTEFKQVMPPSPIRAYTKIDRDIDIASKEETQFRKKNVSETVPAVVNEDYSKELKTKINSNHSRKVSENNYDESSKALQKLIFKAKMQTSSDYVPRGSHNQMLETKNLRIQKLMNQTDPSASYFQLSATRKTSEIASKRQQALNLKIQDFQLGPCKGEGRFGKVYPAIHKKTGWMMAIKQIKKEEVRLMLDQFVQQIKINLYADHPNIVKMYAFFSDRTYFYIVMEYMEEGSLYKAIKVSKKLKEDDTRQKLYQICDAVNYLHSNDILHRDIKPQNIVLSNGVSKLCDFGWAIYSKERRNTYCGTLDYVCPQILQGQSYDNFVDIWAIGVLAYEMLIGKAPFYHISRKQTMKSILNCQFSFPNEISVNAKYFIKKALKKNPDQRFTIQSLLEDRFLSGLCSKN